MDLTLIKDYIKPELLVLIFVLYFIGAAIKKSKIVKDKFIPFILGGIGIVLCSIYTFATSDYAGAKEVLAVVFTSLTQGILVAALSTYVDQLIKQSKKEE